MSYFPFKGFLLATLFSYQVVGQTSFDQGLKSMAQDISSQIENTDIKKIDAILKTGGEADAPAKTDKPEMSGPLSDYVALHRHFGPLAVEYFLARLGAS